MAVTVICPHCGSGHTKPGKRAGETGAVLGGLSGAAILVLRVVGRSVPVLPATLLTAAVIGLLWGAKAGQVVGTRIDDFFPHRARCRACGSEFDS
ncbi:MAG: hypothetical protein COW05_04725 [Gammaproteobacteria bacterium CG12_big_fil_rev_8_21_14_0_65_46_12]|nr:MAG: hypothetical protein COW05_04725 [Gammaproteobacteria bacterium CG12_big_fil_rev_8_21_14_0_65_46_12]